MFALETSKPVSTILVHTKTSYFLSKKSNNEVSNWSGGICPCAITTFASGTKARTISAACGSVCTRLCIKKTCPPRYNSYSIASRISVSLMLCSSVCIGRRSGGGVFITLRSRAAISENCKVRGIGVAVSVSVSTFALISRSFSFAATPNFCSSSMISKPKFLNFSSLLKRACVPIKISILPSATEESISFFCFAVLKRFKKSTVTLNSLRRSRNVFACCTAKIARGTSIATCLPSAIALNAARTATSVLPKPTSPHTSLSIGIGFSISAFTSCVARNWSGVSW